MLPIYALSVPTPASPVIVTSRRIGKATERVRGALFPGSKSLPVPRDTNMNVKELIEILRELPKGSMVVLQRKEFETLFRDSDPRRRAENIARLNGCDLTLDEKSGVARFTRVG